MKKLGHAIEDWAADQSPFGNSSIIDAKAFDWVERLEKNSGVIRQELIALLSGSTHLPNMHELSPRQINLSKGDGWKSYFFFLLGHRIEESYKRCPETGKLLDSIPGVVLAYFSVLAPGMHLKRHRGAWKGVVRCHLGLIVPEPRSRPPWTSTMAAGSRVPITVVVPPADTPAREALYKQLAAAARMNPRAAMES